MENSGSETQILAVIFDLDGTLINTEQVTKGVLKEFLEKYGKVMDSEKEKTRLGMTMKESSVAIVNDYDLPLTPQQFVLEIMPMYQDKWQLAKALPGANRLMDHLYKHGIPFALASNSLRRNIDGKLSSHPGWEERFSVILGSDQVKSGKPSPDLYSTAAEKMGVNPMHCLVIEDSVIGVEAGKAAGMKVVAVPSLQSPSFGTYTSSYSIADSILNSLLEFEPKQWGLPPFEDFIGNALPIDPIHITGGLKEALLYPDSDSELLIPDQMYGLYIAWLWFDDDSGFLKSILNISWSQCSSGSKRKIQVCILDEIDDGVKDDKIMKFQIVGYLRRSSKMSSDVADEDKEAAEAALELNEFCIRFCMMHWGMDSSSSSSDQTS